MNDDAKGDCNKKVAMVIADATSILLGGAIIAFCVGRVVSIIGWLSRLSSGRFAAALREGVSGFL